MVILQAATYLGVDLKVTNLFTEVMLIFFYSFSQFLRSGQYFQYEGAGSSKRLLILYDIVCLLRTVNMMDVTPGETLILLYDLVCFFSLVVLLCDLVSSSALSVKI